MVSKESPPGSGNTLELSLDEARKQRAVFREAYLNLADDVRSAGLVPSELPEWEMAESVHKELYDALAKYEHPRSQSQVNLLESKIRAAFDYYNNEVRPAVYAAIERASSSDRVESPVSALGARESATAPLASELVKSALPEGTREELKEELSARVHELVALTQVDKMSGQKPVDATGAQVVAATEQKPLSGQEVDVVKSATDIESERAIMHAAGEAYFAAYKALHVNGLGRADTGPEVELLAELKRTYDATRAAYYRDSLKEGADFSALQKEVLLDSIERETQLKVESLSEKQRGTVMKAVEWYGGMNRGLEARLGKTGGRAVRALAGGALVFGGFSVFGGAGTLAAAGYGSWRAAKAFLASSVGGAAAEAAGKWFRGFAEKSADAARARLGMKGAAPGADLSIDAIERIDAQRRKLSYDASEAAIARKVALGKALVALGFGAGLSAWLSDAVVEADVKTPVTVIPAEPIAPQVSAAAVESVPAPAEVVPSAAPVPQGLDDMNAVVDEIHEVTAKSGDGAIRMLDRLHDDLVAKGITSDTPGISPEMKAVLEADTPTEVAELAQKLGFYDPTSVNESAVIGRGASLKFEDGKLLFTQAGGQPQMVSADTPFTGTFNDTSPSGPRAQSTLPSAQPEAAAVDSSAPIERPIQTPAAEGGGSALSRAGYEQLSDAEKVAYLNTHKGVVPDPVASPSLTESASISSQSAPPLVQESVRGAPEPASSVAAGIEASSSVAIRSITESPVWDAYKDRDSWTLVFLDLPPGSPESGIRSQIFNLMRSTGVGPSPGEELDEYLARAARAIELGTAETTAIYQVDGYAVAHGGDLLARQILATEYKHFYPNAPVIIENVNGYSETELFQGKFINKVVPVPFAPETADYSKRLY